MFNIIEGISDFFGLSVSCPGSDPATAATSSFDPTGIGVGSKTDHSPAQPSSDSSDSHTIGAWGTAQNQIAASEASSLFPTQSVTTETWGSIDSSVGSSSSPIGF
jgi:hypothetical protein